MDIPVSNLTLAPGDILIEKARPNTIWGWGAKVLYKSDFQHALIVDLDTEVCIENSWWVRRRSTPRDLDHYEVWRPMCNHDTKVRVLRRLQGRLCEPYGFLQLFAFFLYRRFGVKLPDVPLETCSEIIEWAYAEEGYDLNPRRPDHETGPADLRNPETSVQLHIEHSFA